jgi:hypothetical protein
MLGNKKPKKIELIETYTQDGFFNLTFEVEADFSEEFLSHIHGYDPKRDADLEEILSIADDKAYISFENELVLQLYRNLPHQEILDFEGIEAGSQIMNKAPQTYKEAIKDSKCIEITIDLKIPIKATYTLESTIENWIKKILNQ